MKFSAYRSDAGHPRSVFHDSRVLDLLAANLGGRNESIRVEEDGGALDCPIITDTSGAITTGVPSCLPIPRFTGEPSIRLYRRLMDIYLDHLESLSEVIDVRLDPVTPKEHVDLKPLLDRQFSTNLDFSTVIDTRATDGILIGAMRRRYRNSIRQVERSDRIEVHCAKTPEGAAGFERWLALHRTVAARASAQASEAAELIGRKLFADGVLEVIAVERGTRLISGALICSVGVDAYYWQGATDPGEEGLAPYGHSMLWAAMRRLRERGVKRFEIGPVFFGARSASRSEKERSISFFKLGLGGRVLPWLTLSRRSPDVESFAKEDGR